MGVVAVHEIRITLVVASFALGCAVADDGRLQRNDPADPTEQPGADAGDALDLPDGGGGAGGDAGGAQRDSGADPVPTCVPNPDPDDEVCREICPETCNGEDDDCDLRIDEATDLCELAQADARCTPDGCVIDACAADFDDCDGEVNNGCETDLRTLEHCGSCENSCERAQELTECILGHCTVVDCKPGFADCDGSTNTCETPTDASVSDCGGCAMSCPGGFQSEPYCEAGMCSAGLCVGNYGDCNAMVDDGCEQELNTAAHCGACGTPCALSGTSASCATGVCLGGACQPGFADCDGDDSNGCEALDTADNCGACGQACSAAALEQVASATCGGAGCQITCKAGYGNCDGNPSNGCETSLNSNLHCGGCNTPCAFANALADCGTGTCQFGGCLAGYGDCGGGTANGCETHVNSDVNHCGGCGNDCPADKLSCGGGICSDVQCVLPMADCNGDDITCDGNLSLVGSCGACSNACTFNSGVTPHGTLACRANMAGNAWSCGVNCSAGWADCDGDYRNGCEASLSTLTNCGGCGQPCAIPNAGETCATGSCRVTTCEPDWADCNNDMTSCETRLNTTTTCGACGTSCNLPNAVATCGGSVGSRSCQVASCTNSYYANCDNNPANGCEVDTRSSTAHCGTCGTSCNALPNVQNVSCQNSACSIGSCQSGYGNCTVAPGCETAINTLSNCGACGNDCAIALPNTLSQTCAGGTTCQVGTCVTGYGDCTAAAGCETNIQTSATHCGGCAGSPTHDLCTGLAHVNQSACMGGLCNIMQCAAGYEDCNGDSADGCEWRPAVDGPCCNALVDADSDGVNECNDQCEGDPNKTAPGDCGCGNTPAAAGTACNDGACAQNVACDGAGTCGHSYDCGLLGHFRLDETSGSTTADSSGNGHTGTLLNMVSNPWVAGSVAGALQFDGSNDAVDVGQIPVSGAITISAWFRSHTTSGYRAIVTKRDNDMVNRCEYCLEKNLDDNEIQFGFNTGGTWYLWRTTSFNLATNTWYHVVVTYQSGSAPKFYKNGASAAASQTYGSGTPARPSNSAPTQIGNVSNPSKAPEYDWDGELDDVRIYNRILTAAEIQALSNL